MWLWRQVARTTCTSLRKGSQIVALQVIGRLSLLDRLAPLLRLISTQVKLVADDTCIPLHEVDDPREQDRGSLIDLSQML